MAKILLVEDEIDLLETVRDWLLEDSYAVESTTSGEEAQEMLSRQNYDLLILDWMLPGKSGLELCTSYRAKGGQAAILMLTARRALAAKEQAFDGGADDYLTKPFNLEELILRVNNLVKRSLKGDDLKEFNSYKIGDKTIHFNSFELVNEDDSITPLTKKETMLLKLLIERRNDAVSREQILETVWNYDVYPSTRTIDNFILTFRKYFEPDPKNPVYFHSIRGVGYKFTDNH